MMQRLWTVDSNRSSAVKYKDPPREGEQVETERVSYLCAYTLSARRTSCVVHEKRTNVQHRGISPDKTPATPLLFSHLLPPDNPLIPRLSPLEHS